MTPIYQPDVLTVGLYNVIGGQETKPSMGPSSNPNDDMLGWKQTDYNSVNLQKMRA